MKTPVSQFWLFLRYLNSLLSKTAITSSGSIFLNKWSRPIHLIPGEKAEINTFHTILQNYMDCNSADKHEFIQNIYMEKALY